MAEYEISQENLYEQVPVGLFRAKRGGALLEANHTLVRMLGYPDKHSLLGAAPDKIFANLHEFEVLFQLMEGRGRVRGFEIQLKDAQGKVIPAVVNARLVKNQSGESLYLEGSVDPHARRSEAEPVPKTLLDSLSEGVFVFDGKLRYTYWNRFMEELTGLGSAAVIGKRTHEIPPLPKLENIAGMLQRALAGEAVHSRDVYYEAPSRGKSGWYASSFVPHRNRAGQIVGVVGTIQDITSRKLSEVEREKLFRSERELRQQAETLGRVSKALGAVLDLPALLNLICRESALFFNADSSHIWMVKPDAHGGGQILEGIAGYGRERDKFVGMQVSLNDPINLAARVIQDQKPVSINQVDEGMRTGISGVFKVNSVLAVPLFKGDQAIGALMIVDTQRPNRFSPRDLEVAMQLGHHAAIAVDNAKLFDAAHSANISLEQAYVSTLEGWAKALELRDAQTEGHSQRVTDMTVQLAEAFGIESDELEQIRRGALLHDIGKMGVPDEILGKKGPLTEEEWAIMRRHPMYAYNLLSPIEYLRPALEIPYNHHEKWDGSGYPRGLSGIQIPLSARIFAVVDVFDALTTDRPYRDAWPREEAISYIQERAGIDFDPHVVEVFLKIVN